MKKIILLLFFGILLIGTASADLFGFDNVKSFDASNSKYGTVTIKNFFGLGGDIAKITLTKNSDLCSGTCYAEGTTTIYGLGKLVDGFSFKNMEKTISGEKVSVNYKILIQDGIKPKVVDNYGYEETMLGNGSIEKTYKIIGTKTIEEPNWIVYNGEDLKEGIYNWRIEGEMAGTDKIDWKGTWSGIQVNEWANWTDIRKVEWSESSDNNCNTKGCGQTFTIGTLGENRNYSFQGGHLDCSKETATSCNYTLYNGSLMQNNIALVSNTTDCSEMNYAGYNFSMPGNYKLVAGQSYGIGVFADQNILCKRNNTGTAYSGGVEYYATNPGGWLSETLDLKFQIWGQNYSDAVPVVTTTLTSPADNTITINSTQNYVVDSVGTGGATLQNVTLYIWNSSTNEVVVNTTSISGTSATTSFTYSLSKDTYKWNAYSCDTTGGVCAWGTNRTITIADYNVNSQTYNNRTTEGNAELFFSNITLNTIAYSNLVTELNYNGIFYNTIKTTYASEFTFNKTVIAPNVVADSNVSFYWKFTLINATGNVTYTTSPLNQTVLNIQVDNCSIYTNPIINYTLKDERTQDIINGTLYNSSIETNLELYPVSSSVQIFNYSFKTNGSSYSSMCWNGSFYNGSEYRLYVQTRYSSDTYSPRYYHLQNYSLKNSTMGQNINLFSLKSIYATQFLMSYKDSSFLAVENALVQLARKYVSEGVYKTIEISKTNKDGQATAYFDLDGGVAYMITVTKDGKILSTHENIVVYCEDRVIGDCKINIYATTTSTAVTDMSTYGNLAYNIQFNQTTKTLTIPFSTIDGSSATVNLTTIKYDGYMNETICSTAITTSSGTLTCVASGKGNITLYSILKVNNNLVAINIQTIFPKTTEIFENNSLILILGLMLTVPFMFIPNPAGVVFGGLLGFAICMVLLNISKDWFTSGSVIGYFIVAGGIIIWRIRQVGQA